MNKVITLIVFLLSVLFTRCEAVVVYITPAGIGYNTLYDGTEYYWGPDGTQSFTMKIFENTYSGSRWHYYLAHSTSNGHAEYAFLDNASDDLFHPIQYDHVFVVVASPVFDLTINGAVARGELPQWWGQVDKFDFDYWLWDSRPLVPMYPNSWAMYVISYRKITDDLQIQLISMGSGTPPSSISSDIEIAYGQ